MTHLAPSKPQLWHPFGAMRRRLWSDLPRLPFLWWRGARFRNQLRWMLEGPDYLFEDVGIDRWAARKEAARRFWQPVLMTPPLLPASADVPVR